MNLFNAFAVSFGAGAGGAATAAYRDWREHRAALPDDVRNSGLLTDRRVRWLHYSLVGGVTAFLMWLAVIILVLAEILPLWMLPIPHQ